MLDTLYPTPSKRRKGKGERRKKKERKEENRTHNHRPHTNQPHIQRRQPHLPPPLRIPSPIHKQPKHATKAVGKPARKEGTDQAQQIVEAGDGLGNNPGECPQSEHDERPGAEARPAALGHAVRAAEEPHVDVFGRDVPVDDARDDDRRDADPVRDFADQGRGGAQRRGRDGLPGVAVDLWEGAPGCQWGCVYLAGDFLGGREGRGHARRR